MTEISKKRRSQKNNRNLLVSYKIRGASLTGKRKLGIKDPMVGFLTRRGFKIEDCRFINLDPPKRLKPQQAKLSIEIQPQNSTAYFVKLIHPHGGITYHFPIKRRRTAKTRVIDVTIKPPSTYPAGAGKPSKSRSQGISYVLILLATSLAPALFKKSIGMLARKWEDKHTAYKLFRISLKGIEKHNPLKSLPHHNGKRGLLLIHGIFASVDTGFASLFEETGRSFLKNIIAAYHGRVIAFDHPSISRTPEENAAWLLEHLEKGGPCRYDVIAHSRGGLVARALVELERKRVRTDASPRGRLLIDRAVLVGTPNWGTPLVPGGRSKSRGIYGRLAVWMANMAPILPVKLFPQIMGFLAELLRYLAVGIPGSLPGLAALAPGSSFLKRINKPSPLGGALYYAIGSNFDRPEQLIMKLADAGIDKLFEGVENDLAVPTAGCAVTDVPVPSERVALYSPSATRAALKANIDHLSFFKTESCLEQIAAFLGIPGESALRALRIPARSSHSLHAATQRAIEPAMPSPMLEEHPDFAFPMHRMDLAVIGDDTQKRAYEQWLRKWKNAIANASITSLPPQPLPLLMASSGLSRTVMTFKTKGEDTYWHSLIGTERSMRRYLEDAGAELSLARLEAAGTMLYQTLFSGDAGRLLERVTSYTRGRSPVLVTFTTTSSWIADFPWEMIFDRNKGRFLSLGDVCFFRGVISTKAAVELPALPLVIRMLVAIAQPRDQVRLDAASEVKGLKQALAPLVASRRLYVDVLEHTSTQSLISRLKKTHYHLLHYIGHADYDEETDVGKLILEHPRTGRSAPVDSDALCEILAKHASHLRFVLLNGCETAEGGRADFNRGVAPALVASGVPGVIGNRLIVGDRAAIDFATIFYDELSQRKSLAEAIMTARRKLAASPIFEPYEWAVPMIFAIDPEARFF